MSSVTFLWLCGAMAVFLTATSALRHYIGTGQLAVLIGALALYCVGNLIMVRVMRDSGMAVAISISAVLQLVLAT
jgi:glucose uptake protein